MGMSMVNVELNDCEIQCLEDERKYLGPCHFPVPRGSWQKPSSFLMIASIPHPCSPALLLLSHQMRLQTWGLALALLNSWTICLNPLFWKVFGFFYQRYWLISKYYSKYLGAEMIMFKESQCHLSINWSCDCHRAGKVCTGLVYDRMCVRGLKVSWDFPYGKYRIFGPDLWGNFHFPLLNSFPLKIWSDSWNRGSHPAALHSLMCLSQNIYWASAMCRYGSPEKQN